DDEQPARDMVGDYLRMHGFTVTLCEGGASLRKSFAEQTPDLIVLDLNMPEEDGLSVIRDLKQRSSVPIIMLTATASAIDRVVGAGARRRRFSRKPGGWGGAPRPHPRGGARRGRGPAARPCREGRAAADRADGRPAQTRAVRHQMARPRRAGTARRRRQRAPP